MEQLPLWGDDEMFLSVRFTEQEAKDISNWCEEHHKDPQELLHDTIMDALYA